MPSLRPGGIFKSLRVGAIGGGGAGGCGALSSAADPCCQVLHDPPAQVDARLARKRAISGGSRWLTPSAGLYHTHGNSGTCLTKSAVSRDILNGFLALGGHGCISAAALCEARMSPGSPFCLSRSNQIARSVSLHPCGVVHQTCLRSFGTMMMFSNSLESRGRRVA